MFYRTYCIGQDFWPSIDVCFVGNTFSHMMQKIGAVPTTLLASNDRRDIFWRLNFSQHFPHKGVPDMTPVISV